MFRKDTVMNLSAILTDATADNDHRMVFIDLGADALRREFVLTGKTVTGEVAPGSSKTLVVNHYFTDYVPAGVDVGTVLTGGAAVDGYAAVMADRKTANSAKTLTNDVSITQEWQFSSGILRPLARYLAVSFNKPQLDSGGTADVLIEIARVPSQLQTNAL